MHEEINFFLTGCHCRWPSMCGLLFYSAYGCGSTRSRRCCVGTMQRVGGNCASGGWRAGIFDLASVHCEEAGCLRTGRAMQPEQKPSRLIQLQHAATGAGTHVGSPKSPGAHALQQLDCIVISATLWRWRFAMAWSTSASFAANLLGSPSQDIGD